RCEFLPPVSCHCTCSASLLVIVIGTLTLITCGANHASPECVTSGILSPVCFLDSLQPSNPIQQPSFPGCFGLHDRDFVSSFRLAEQSHSPLSAEPGLARLAGGGLLGGIFSRLVLRLYGCIVIVTRRGLAGKWPNGTNFW